MRLVLARGFPNNQGMALNGVKWVRSLLLLAVSPWRRCLLYKQPAGSEQQLLLFANSLKLGFSLLSAIVHLSQIKLKSPIPACNWFCLYYVSVVPCDQLGWQADCALAEEFLSCSYDIPSVTSISFQCSENTNRLVLIFTCLCRMLGLAIQRNGTIQCNLWRTV